MGALDQVALAPEISTHSFAWLLLLGPPPGLSDTLTP